MPYNSSLNTNFPCISSIELTIAWKFAYSFPTCYEDLTVSSASLLVNRQDSDLLIRSAHIVQSSWGTLVGYFSGVFCKSNYLCLFLQRIRENQTKTVQRRHLERPEVGLIPGSPTG
jgi:hypothetical protein